MRKMFFLMIILAVFSAGTIAQTGSIKVGNSTRTFVVYTPSGLPEHPSLVISMHGLGGDGSQQRSMSGFDKVADKGKFVVVYPDGVYKMNNSNGWDISGNTDVEFITVLIDTMTERYKIDPNRIYASGFSMGGMMSYKLACTLSDKIAAIGPASGYPLGNMITNCTPTRPVPICHTHGTIDSIVPYTGLENWVSKFVKSNGCSGAPVTTNPTSQYKREYWGPCDKGGEIIIYHFDGMKHGYVNTSKYDFSASDTFWTFFQKHTLNNSEVGIAKTFLNFRKTSSISVAYSSSTIYVKSEAGIHFVRVSDISGRELLFRQGSDINLKSIDIPVSSTLRGIYLVNVADATGHSVVRVLVP